MIRWATPDRAYLRDRRRPLHAHRVSRTRARATVLLEAAVLVVGFIEIVYLLFVWLPS